MRSSTTSTTTTTTTSTTTTTTTEIPPPDDYEDKDDGGIGLEEADPEDSKYKYDGIPAWYPVAYIWWRGVLGVHTSLSIFFTII